MCRSQRRHGFVEWLARPRVLQRSTLSRSFSLRTNSAVNISPWLPQPRIVLVLITVTQNDLLLYRRHNAVDCMHSWPTVDNWRGQRAAPSAIASLKSRPAPSLLFICPTRLPRLPVSNSSVSLPPVRNDFRIVYASCRAVVQVDVSYCSRTGCSAQLSQLTVGRFSFHACR